MPKSPTAKQLHYLRTLAARTGTTFVPPDTSADAIRRSRLDSRRPDAFAERDRRRIEANLAQGRGDAVRFRRSEVSGYGAGVRWTDHAEDDRRMRASAPSISPAR